MSFVFGGDDHVPLPPVLPPPPKPQEIMDVIDRISGAQSRVVTGPNGKKYREIVRLPRTAEEQRFFNIGGELIREGLKSIQELYKYNPMNVVDIQPVINAIADINEKRAADLSKIADFGDIKQDIQNFRNIQKTMLNDELKRGKNRLENNLAILGRSSGTYGAAQRAYFENEAAKTRQLNDIQALQYGETLAAQRLGRNLKAYEARQGARENQLRNAQLEYTLKQQRQNDLDNRRRELTNESLNQIKLGSGLRGEDMSRAMGSNASELSLRENALRNRSDIDHYNSVVNNLNANYQNQLAHHQATQNQGSFGDFLGGSIGNILGTVGGSMLMGPSGSGGNMLFNKLFG